MAENSNPLEQLFLAGVGAVAMGIERVQPIVDDLVAKGKLTVEQGKEVAADVSSRTEEETAKIRDQIITAHMKTMTKEQRDEFAARVAEMASTIDAEDELETEEILEAEAAAKTE